MLCAPSAQHSLWDAMPCERKWHSQLTCGRRVAVASVGWPPPHLTPRQRIAIRRRVALFSERELGDAGDTPADEVPAPGQVVHAAVIDLFGLKSNGAFAIGSQIARPDAQRPRSAGAATGPPRLRTRWPAHARKYLPAPAALRPERRPIIDLPVRRQICIHR